MAEQKLDTTALATSDAPSDGRLLVKWLEEKPVPSQAQLANAILQDFLQKASQPRHASGNACIQLCYYIEQCRSSSSAPIRDVVFSKETCLSLFNFCIELNGKNQNRSMQQVLQLSSSLIARNPSELTSKAVKNTILERTLSIIAHQASQSLVKPAFKSLECYLDKTTISPEELLVVYEGRVSSNGAPAQVVSGNLRAELWDSFILDVFDWMVLPDISPGAGKFLVTLFKALKPAFGSAESRLSDYSTLWQRWIRNGLAKDPEAFENVKNYLFPPLFKIDRPGSLAFLESLNQQRAISDLQSQEVDAHALLQLAAMDVGKKAGLVEEPSSIQFQKNATKKPAACIILQEDAIGNLMCSFSAKVRSLAFSVLVSTASSIRPFSPVVLDLFQSRLGVLYSDTDAKFRNETLTNSKHMIERIRGATAFLVRELDQVSFKLDQDLPIDSEQKTAQQALYDGIKELLDKHESFVKRYMQFLLGELVPTASYQRHITSLKAIKSLLQSRILHDDSAVLGTPVPVNSTVWPFTVEFFTPRSLRLLLDLLMDPFEDVRVGASDVLAFAPRDCFGNRVSEGALNKCKSQSSHLKTDDTCIAGTFENESIIIHKPDCYSPSRPLGLLLDFIDRAKEASRKTGRADYADGVARSYRVLYDLQRSGEEKSQLLEDLVRELEDKVEIAAKDLTRAVIEAPVHASFAALNLVWDTVSPSLDLSADTLQAWEKWFGFMQRMVLASSGVWEAVSEILCNDSPEGHLPEEVDELEAIDTKNVLSYSFRAVHESSNLLRTVVNKLNQKSPETFALTASKHFVEIGDLTFLQLSTLRHRGAFSTVSLTFAVCCQQTQRIVSSPESTDTDMLHRWWKGTKEAIRSQASTTRRSAGIPALITGIMSADAASPSFEDIMTDLKFQAQSPIVDESADQNLPQVHALNGLKDTFKNAVVRKRAETHVLSCLRIASDALNSETWAIRNCGLLLFQSLINYLVGTQSKKKTEAGWDGGAKAISYDKYPNLGELLLQLLEASEKYSNNLSSSSALETIFPVLDILRRAGPPDDLRDHIVARLFHTIGHRVWQIRELSAKTLCALTTSDEWIDILQLLTKPRGDVSGDGIGENQKHGNLLGAKLLLERYLSESDLSLDFHTIALALRVCFSLDRKSLRSPFGLAALFDLQNTILAFLTSLSNESKVVYSNNLKDLVKDSFPSESCLHLNNLLADCGSFSGGWGQLNRNCTPGRACIAAFKQAIYLSVFGQNISALARIVDLASNSYGIAVLTSALECISEVWVSANSQDVLHRLAIIHLDVLRGPVCARAPGLRALILNNLCSIFNMAGDQQSTHFRSAMTDLDGVLATATIGNLPTNPNLCAATDTIIGFSILSEALTSKLLQEATKHRVEQWGSYMRINTQDSKDFDIRFAAAQSLRYFLNNDGIGHILGEDCLLEPLLSLYTTLNDDDEEIRELGASTVALLTHNLSTPLQAVQDLTTWMVENYSSSVSFARIVVHQMTGSEAAKRIQLSLDPDNSLFVEEDSNLFVDEVREVRLWTKVFHGLSKKVVEKSHLEESALITLASWVLNGLKALDTLLAEEDGPLGSISKPETYYPCLQVLICTNALIQYLTSHYLASDGNQLQISEAEATSLNMKAILRSLKSFISSAEKRKIHEDLIFEVISPDSLAKTRLEILQPECTNVSADHLTLSLGRSTRSTAR